MSKEKIATEHIRLESRLVHKRSADTAPNQQLQVLSLELEEDAGGDPYNRTGQFCVLERKNEER